MGIEIHLKELDRLSLYMKLYIDNIGIRYCESKYKDISDENKINLTIAYPYNKISNGSVSLCNVGYLVNFNDTTSRSNKDGSLLCNEQGVNNIKDIQENKDNYIRKTFNL